MTEVDLFGVYVRRELDHWGREFALHRDCDIRDWVVDTAMVLLVTIGFVLADRRGWTQRGQAAIGEEPVA